MDLDSTAPTAVRAVLEVIAEARLDPDQAIECIEEIIVSLEEVLERFIES